MSLELEELEPLSTETQVVRGKSKNALGSLGWSLASQLGRALSEMLTLLVLARLLKPEEFGLATTGVIVVQFTFMLSQLGAGQVVIQRKTLSAEQLSSALLLSLTSSICYASALFFLAPQIAWFFHSPAVAPIIRVLGVPILFNGVANIYDSVLVRNHQFRASAMTELCCQLLGYATVAIVFAFLGAGAWALVYASVCRSVIKLALVIVFSPKLSLAKPSMQGIRDITGLGRYFAGSEILNYAAIQGDNAVVGRMLGQAALGLYGRAYQLMVAPAAIIGQGLDRVLFAYLARIQDNRERLAQHFTRTSVLLAVITMPFSAWAIILAPEIIGLLLGAKWTAIILPFQLLACAQFFRTAYRISDGIARAVGAAKSRMKQQLVYAISVITLAWIGSRWGISGVSAGVAVAIVINYMGMLLVAGRQVSLESKYFLISHIPPLKCTTILVIVGAPLAYLMRKLGCPSILTISAVTGLCGILYVYLLRALPLAMLGNEGMSGFEMVSRQVPGKVRRLMTRALPWIASIA